MEILSNKRCVIGEGPVWNPFDKRLYYVNAFADEVCTYDPATGEETVKKYDFSVGAFGFTKNGAMLVSCTDGPFVLHPDGSRTPMANAAPVNCNDAKVGPDGRFYVGTQSRKRMGLGDEIDGCLYSVDAEGVVRVLLTGLRLSNGFDWSMDEKRFYHTDSDTHTIREYDFDKATGRLEFTGRAVSVPGVDGFCMGRDDRLYVACWGKGHLAVVDTRTMTVAEHIPVPVRIPVSCGFMGENMDRLAVVTASYHSDEPLAGCTFVTQLATAGREPYLFGEE